MIHKEDTRNLTKVNVIMRLSVCGKENRRNNKNKQITLHFKHNKVMYTNILKNSKISVFTLCLALASMISLGIFTQSCSEEESINNLPFLHLSREYSSRDLNNMPVIDLEIFRSALKRITISENKGIYQMNIKSGSDVNISENLFHIFKDIIEISNNNALIKPVVPRLKSGNEGNTATDCVARVINTLSTFFNKVISYFTANNHIVQNYGNDGVTLSECNEVMNYFFTSVDSPKLTSSFVLPAGSQALVVINGGTHAVRYLGTSGSLLLYHDPQTNSTGFVLIPPGGFDVFTCSGVK